MLLYLVTVLGNKELGGNLVVLGKLIIYYFIVGKGLSRFIISMCTSIRIYQ